jgi:hypothetical protein
MTGPGERDDAVRDGARHGGGGTRGRYSWEDGRWAMDALEGEARREGRTTVGDEQVEDTVKGEAKGMRRRWVDGQEGICEILCA